jgi:hypothetical protein
VFKIKPIYEIKIKEPFRIKGPDYCYLEVEKIEIFPETIDYIGTEYELVDENTVIEKNGKTGYQMKQGLVTTFCVE